MLKFKKVRFQNFLSQGAQMVEIEIDKDKTTIITGTNGSGKSTVIDCILFTLFNKPLRDIKLGQLVNTINKKKLRAEIEFSTNGVEYKIVRGMKPAIFEIYKDGDLINQDASARDLQNKLETEILRTNYRTFTQVVVLASMKFKNFMDLTPPERRVVVEQMLDIEVIGHMSVLLKDRIKDVSRRAGSSDINHREILQSISNVQRLIDASQDNTGEQLLQYDAAINDIDANIKTLSGEYEVAKLGLEQEQSLKPEIDVEGNTEAYNTANAIQQKLNGIRQDQCSKLAIANNNITTTKRDASFYTNNTDCGTCGQYIDDDFKNRIVGDMESKIAASLVDVETHRKHIATADERIQVQATKLADIHKLAEILGQWQSKCDLMLNNMRNIQQRATREQQIKQSTMNDKSTLLGKSKTNTDQYFIELDKHNKHIEEIIAIRAEITEEMELCKLCGDMLKDNGIKAKIIKQYLPVINDSINYYLDKLGGNYSFVLDEQFNETIKSRYRDTFSYGSFSNGESMRINIAILLMWRKLAESKNTVHTNLLVMDEVLDGSLDEEGIQAVLGIFEESNSNIFVISHRHEIIPNFDRHIQVSKVGNFAQYNGLTDEV